MKIRMFVAEDNFLYSYLTESTKHNSGEVKFSQGMKLGALQFRAQAGEESPKAIIYQIASDATGKYEDLNLLIYQNFDIVGRIGFFDQGFDREKYGESTPAVHWAGYFIKNVNFGYFWLHVGSKTGMKMRFYVHYIIDKDKELEFTFDFDFPNPGHIHIDVKNKKYVEINGVSNTAAICLFDPTQEYLKYEEFKSECTNRNLTINLQSGEYISDVSYSSYGSLLVTVVSKNDSSIQRKIWSYVDDNMPPSFDFDKNLYLQKSDRMWEIPKTFEKAENMIAKSYKAKSTSYFLVQKASLERVQNRTRFDTFRSKAQESNSDILTVGDGDGPDLQITLTFEQTKVFYPVKYSVNSFDLQIDQLDYQFEFGHRGVDITGDSISFKGNETTEHYMTLTPVIATQKYQAMMNEGGIPQNETWNNSSTLLKGVILETEIYDVLQEKGVLSQLGIKANSSFLKEGSPYIMLVDLKYLKISIKKYSSSNKYGVLLIEENTNDGQVSLLQFYQDFSYEIRKFQGRYLNEIGGYKAFTSNLEGGLEYFMAPRNTDESNSNICLHFSIRKMYPMVIVKSQLPAYPSAKIDQNFESIVYLNNDPIKFTVSKILGPNEISFQRLKPIDIINNKDIYVKDLRQYYSIKGNGFYVDKTINFLDPDYHYRSIRIEDTQNHLFYRASYKFHSFARGVENNFVIVNYQNNSIFDCKIGHYTVFMKENPILIEIGVDSIDSQSSFFDSILSADGSKTYLVHLFKGYNSQYKLDLIQYTDISSTSKSDLKDTENSAFLIKSIKMQLDASDKVHLTKNPFENGQVLLFLIDSQTHQINVYMSEIETDPTFKKVYFTERYIHLTDFEVIIFKGVAFILAVHRETVTNANETKFIIKGLNLKTFREIENLDTSELMSALPSLNHLNKIQCRKYRVSYEGAHNFDCVLQANEFDLFNLMGSIELHIGTQEGIQAKFTNNEVQNYKLPYFFNLGHCQLSEAFIVCEMDIPMSSDLKNLKLGSGALKNKLLMSVTFPKVKQKKVKNDGKRRENHRGTSSNLHYASRLAIVPFEYLCSNSNNYFLRSAESNKVQLIYLSNPLIQQSGASLLRKMDLESSLELFMNFTDYDHKKLIDATKINIWMSPRTSKKLLLTADDFEILNPRDSFLEISFWICGVIILCVVLFMIIKQWCRGVNEEAEYKNLFSGEDKQETGSRSSYNNYTSHGFNGEGVQGWGGTGIIERDSIESNEYGGGMRYQNMTERDGLTFNNEVEGG